MNMFAILVGLGPLIGWGLFPTISSKIGGKPTNQIFGATVGTLIFAIILMLINGTQIPTGSALFFGIVSGAAWSFGQIMSFKAFEFIGSSKTMPITTAFQLIVTSLWGAFALGNWPGVSHKVVGIIALIVIIAGATMTTYSETSTKKSSSNLKKAVIILAIGVIGYWGYSAAPQAVSNMNGMEAFLPQAIGMVLVAVIYSLFNIKKENIFKDPISYKQIISGFFFAFAAFTYLISAQPDMNGLATGFVLSQTSVVVATLTGIYMLGQKKTKKEMLITIIGLILIILAASVTVLL
ncbi:ribose transporter RbsU [Lactobacillus sp. S2-2]|uniref:ribose/proton symporter RbsU n=1 Tax=Lactobacillus sp. S2-2 TaxID=2692917 RepID=UPI001F16FBEF|nr:GRP family sugar transporter [Lactobacillus sp. S2-2]MCF6514651.1 ribose transporter RbsU [Lactobacillus sp. S2-2]